jgi:hypothetical protein
LLLTPPKQAKLPRDLLAAGDSQIAVAAAEDHWLRSATTHPDMIFPRQGHESTYSTPTASSFKIQNQWIWPPIE